MNLRLPKANPLPPIVLNISKRCTEESLILKQAVDAPIPVLSVFPEDAAESVFLILKEQKKR